MKKTRLPKSARPLHDHALALTRRIQRLSRHFARTPAHFRNRQAKQALERLINRRGQALEMLFGRDPKLCEETTTQIRKGGAD